MTPDDDWTPIKKALAVIFDHPEVVTLDREAANSVEHRIAELSTFQPVWNYISTHPMAQPGRDGATADPWASRVPIADAPGVEAWQLSVGMREVISTALDDIVRELRPPPVSAPPVAITGAGGGSWRITDLAPRFGLRFPTIAFDHDSRSYAIDIVNHFPRHVGVYAEFTAASATIAPDSWASRLPSGGSTLESATTKFLGIAGPNVAVAGVALPNTPTHLSFVLPAGADGVRLMFSGVGSGSAVQAVDAAGVLLTAVLDMALPIIMDGAGGASSATWFSGVLADEAIVDEIVAAAAAIFDPIPSTTAALLTTIEGNMAAWLLGGRLPRLEAAIADELSPTAVSDAARVLGWSATDLAVQLTEPAAAQTSSRLLSSPATAAVEMLPISVSVAPDPTHGEWPDVGETCAVTISADGSTLAEIDAPIPDDGGAVEVTIPGIPAGCSITATATVSAANGWKAGHAASTAQMLGATNEVHIRLEVAERVVPLTSATTYEHRRSLGYDGSTKTHRWVAATAAAPSVSSVDGLVGITVSTADRTVGYAWRSATGDRRFAFQRLGVADAERTFVFSGEIFSLPTHVVDDRRPGAPDCGFFLDPRTASADGLLQLRTMTTDPLSETSTWGTFFGSPTAMAVHPAGFVVACDTDSGTVQAVELPATATTADRAPRERFVVGPGSAIGQVDQPVAVAVDEAGAILVLEQGSNRIQAFDPFGNSVARFADGSPVLVLPDRTGVRYQDVTTGPNGAIIVLSVADSSSDTTPSLDLFAAKGRHLGRSSGIAAERISGDAWGRLYAISTATFEGPGGRREPMVTQWSPSAPPPARTFRVRTAASSDLWSATSSSRFAISPDDLAALDAVRSIAQLLGPAAPPITGDGIFRLMGAVDTLAAAAARVTNPLVAAAAESIFDMLATVPTNFGVGFPGMYVAYHYAIYDFAPSVDPWAIDTPMTNDEQVWLTGTVPLSTAGGPTTAMVKMTGWSAPVSSTWNYAAPTISGSDDFLGVGNRLLFGPIGCTLPGFVGTRANIGLWRPGWVAPRTGSVTWIAALAAAVDKLGQDTDLCNQVMPRTTVPAVRQTMAAEVLTPSKWTNVGQVQVATTPVWAAQTASVRAMLAPETLPAGAYLFLLDLLGMLGWGDGDAHRTIERIVSAPADSTIYPNTSFGDQLVYAALLALVAPTGAYDWNHDQLVEFVSTFAAALADGDPGSSALRASVEAQAHVLRSDDAYPSQDPNVPNVGFDERMTDTLFALDKARRSLR